MWKRQECGKDKLDDRVHGWHCGNRKDGSLSPRSQGHDKIKRQNAVQASQPISSSHSQDALPTTIANERVLGKATPAGKAPRVLLGVLLLTGALTSQCAGGGLPDPSLAHLLVFFLSITGAILAFLGKARRTTLTFSILSLVLTSLIVFAGIILAEGWFEGRVRPLRLLASRGHWSFWDIWVFDILAPLLLLIALFVAWLRTPRPRLSVKFICLLTLFGVLASISPVLVTAQINGWRPFERIDHSLEVKMMGVQVASEVDVKDIAVDTSRLQTNLQLIHLAPPSSDHHFLLVDLFVHNTAPHEVIFEPGEVYVISNSHNIGSLTHGQIIPVGASGPRDGTLYRNNISFHISPKDTQLIRLIFVTLKQTTNVQLLLAGRNSMDLSQMAQRAIKLQFEQQAKRAEEYPNHDGLGSTIKEAEQIEARLTNDKVLPYRFNYDLPFAISINRSIPNALTMREELVKLLGHSRMLDNIAFEWFGSASPVPVEVNIGNRVPVEIAQAVIKVLSNSENLSVIVTVMKEDSIVKNNQRLYFGFTQHVYIGSLTKSKEKPLSKEKIDALLKEGLTQKEFLSLLSKSR